MNTHLRPLLTGALALLLLTCTVAAWASPQSQPRANPTLLTAAAGGSPCDMVIGPAYNYCTRDPSAAGPTTATDVAGPSAVAAVVPAPASLDGRFGLMLFATAAIGGAIGLVLTVERRMR